MNTNGFVEEDDLILYAMQALSPVEMEQMAQRLEGDAALGARLAGIQSVLGIYATEVVAPQDAPAAALERLLSAVAAEKPAVAVAPARAVVPEPEVATVLESRRDTVVASKPSWGVRLGLLWGGWAVAALLLVGVGLLYQQNRRTEETAATARTGLATAQSEARETAAERDRLRQSLDRQSASVQAREQELSQTREEASASQKEALEAKNRSAELNAKVAGSDLRAERERARADALAEQARENVAAKSELNAALQREQAAASQAAESQQVLAALADPSALHVTLTVPKQKKRPSGRGTYLSSNGTLVFTGSDLEALPAGKVYELWLMPADGSAPIPAGTFSPDATGNATLISNKFQRNIAAKGFAITAEPAGGSQTPTLPILLLGGV